MHANECVCDSELHVFRGHQPSGAGFIMGHEYTGTVVEVGSGVKTVKPGDKIVSPFTASWYVEPDARYKPQIHDN